MPMVATKGPYVLLLKDDDMPDNPRESCDSFGTMVCFHRRYKLGEARHLAYEQEQEAALDDREP